MKSIFTALLLGILTNLGFAQVYVLKADQCEVEWTGKAAFGSYFLSGTIDVASGQIRMLNSTLTEAKLDMDMTSIHSNIRKLTKHLKSEDFFEVRKHKKATFRLTSPIALRPDTPSTIKGALTIKGIAKPYDWVVSIAKKGDRLLVSAKSITIDRTDFGIRFNSPNYFQNLKDQAIADEFSLSMRLIFEKVEPDRL